jgi:hypothetical protein
MKHVANQSPYQVEVDVVGRRTKKCRKQRNIVWPKRFAEDEEILRLKPSI